MGKQKNPTLYYPMVGFHFQVEFKDMGNKGLDVNFQSVTGLEATIDVETIKEGGENRFEHGLPGRTKYASLNLKRGALTSNESAVTQWCIHAFRDNLVRPVDLTITLLGQQHQPLVVWEVIHAWPKSWKFNELNAEKGEVFLETLELQYNRFEAKPA